MSHLRRRSSFINKAVGEVPIMSFQTNKNGTFNPTMTIAAGTLRWIIDGEEQITNSPSKVLTGSTVDVQVFANDIIDGVEVTSVLFNSQNIIGTLSFNYFTLNGAFRADANPSATNLTFSDNANIATSFLASACNYSSLDLSNVTISGGSVSLQSNLNLASITHSSGANTSSDYRIFNCNSDIQIS